eukprot:10915499-Heterocapsa_arctica.AAC.1
MSNQRTNLVHHIGDVIISRNYIEEHSATNRGSMSYGHRAKGDRATFPAIYIMLEDLENKSHMKALESIVT